MTLRALLLDMDGTLVETGTANFRAYAQALSERGVTVSRAAFEPLAQGRHWRQFLPGLLGGDLEAAAQVAARKAVLYPDQAQFTRLNTGLLRLVRGFIAAGGQAALVSTASRANIDTILHHHGLVDLFAVVVSGNDVTRHKPDPEAYHLAAARLGVGPRECLVFEDSDIGLAAARAFGADVLPVGPFVADVAGM